MECANDGTVGDGETPPECAIRETEADVGVTPAYPTRAGTLDFTFGDEPFMFVHVFRADGYEGTSAESPDARPVWFDGAGEELLEWSMETDVSF